MSTKSRQTIHGGSIIGAKIRADAARETAQKAIREADRAEAEAWSIQMEGYGGPCAALPDHRPLPQRHPARCGPAPLDTPVFVDARAISVLHEFDGGDRPLPVVASDRNSQAVYLIKPDALHRPRLCVCEDHGPANKLRLGLYELAEDGDSAELCSWHGGSGIWIGSLALERRMRVKSRSRFAIYRHH